MPADYVPGIGTLPSVLIVNTHSAIKAVSMRGETLAAAFALPGARGGVLGYLGFIVHTPASPPHRVRSRADARAAVYRAAVNSR